MIPFGGESAVLPSVERTGLRQNNIAFTLVQAPNQLTSISSSPTINNSFSPGIRILQSRSQHRRSSVSSLCSLLKFEDNEFRKLNSRGSSVGELRLCLETKQLASKQFECTENLDNSSCSSTGTEEGKDQGMPLFSIHKFLIVTVHCSNNTVICIIFVFICGLIIFFNPLV